MQAFTHGEELKKADDFRNQAAADQEKTKETLLRASEKTALSGESLEREHAALESASQALRQDKDAVTEMIENGRHSTDIAKNLFASADSLKDRAHAMTETVDQMEVMGRNMSVLALNSAIEAGRLGAGSERYVQAAEQVRNYAEQYGTADRCDTKGTKRSLRVPDGDLQEGNRPADEEQCSSGQNPAETDG